MLAKYQKPPGCADCVLESTGVGYAPPSGPPDAELLFVGESLGFHEAMQGVPFIGAAGGMFHRILSKAEVSRDTVKVHNCVNCRPPNDWLAGAPWEHSALSQCRQYLDPSLNNPNLKVVVTLGETALKNVLNLYGTEGVRVQDFHGTVHTLPQSSGRVYVVPTYHPSHLQRGAVNLLDVVRYDIQVAAGLLRSPYNRRPVSLLLDPPVERFSAWTRSVVERVSADPAAGGGLAVDIETPDKAGGRDEGELTTEDNSTQILRVNFSYGFDEGLSVPYEGPYIPLIEEILSCGVSLSMWNKRYDESRLRFNGHRFTNPAGAGVEILDLMWAAHHYQSDWPLGLGFWAPFASDYGAWKHLAKQFGQDVLYAAIDGLQTKRLEIFLIDKLVKAGLWEAFYRHTHLREQYVLRPAHEVGMPISVPRLDAFHEKCQLAAASELAEIQKIDAAGTFKPKAGYAKKPKGDPPIPPKSVIGDYAGKGDQAKADYINQGVELVERSVDVHIYVCEGCGRRTATSRGHQCVPQRRKKSAQGDSSGDVAGESIPDQPPATTSQVVRESRWFWKLPFNPDAGAQMLAYIRASGEQPGKAKKTKKDTADKDTLKKLYRKTGNPLYLHTLNYKAIKKVDSTYVLGSKKRIWSDGRLHPFITHRPSMMRDSCIAEGTPIEIVRDLSLMPLGVPIERVQVGDLAYTFDDQRKLTLRRVVRAVYTGCKKLVRVHWIGAGGKNGHLDLTHDHRIRLIDGTYKEAQLLHYGDRVLALARGLQHKYSILYATGHDPIPDHRFVYETMRGINPQIVHHDNENTLDNRLWNLIGVTHADHIRKHRTLDLSAAWLEEVLRANEGKPTAFRDVYGLDYRAAIRQCKRHGIDWKQIQRELGGRDYNHFITHVEELEKQERVYDLEIDGTHNFIAGELAVHNCVNPNIQNVIADKEKTADGKTPLAAGFRDCVVADPGYRLVEIDYAGIEAVDTGWLSGDPDYMRLATLGVHAYLTSHVLAETQVIGSAASLSWSDQDLALFFKDIKKKFPAEYDKCKRVVHGNNYGLTTYGMVQNFPEVFTGGLREATYFQDLYYALAPKLPAYHKRMRTFAYEHGYLGGPPVDDYTLLTRGGNHPFGYMHWFWGVQTFRPMNESEYRKLQWIAKNRMKIPQHPRVVIINSRPFEIVMGEDSKRVIAFPPQSIAAGQLKEAELSLFHPDSDYYMGEIAEGKTPLIAPIHDSLLLHLPDHLHEWAITNAIHVMRQPFWQMPMPEEWGMGSHVRVNVSVKVSPVGGSWADVEEIQIPDMAPATSSEVLYLPVDEAEYEDVEDLRTRVVM